MPEGKTDPILTARRLANWIAGEIVRLGDLPVDQYDQDTGTCVRTPADCVAHENGAFVIQNAGYEADATPSITAGRLMAELLLGAAEHGDLPIYQQDADTGGLLPITAQRGRDPTDGAIVIHAASYVETGGHPSPGDGILQMTRDEALLILARGEFENWDDDDVAASVGNAVRMADGSRTTIEIVSFERETTDAI